MKQILTILFLAITVSAIAQENANTMRENGRKLMISGDMAGAITHLKKASDISSDDIEVKKDLALAYYYNKEYKKALDVILPVAQGDDADVAACQLAGTIYIAMQDVKSAEKIYVQALKDFPRSGPIYSEYGELLELIKKPKEAIAVWEKGMEVAPSFSGNYYNAAIYYYKQPVDKIYAILYGEIYANMESLNPKSLSIKKMIVDTYKDLFSGNNIQSAIKDTRNEFAKAVLQTYAKQSGLSTQAVTPETLGMARTRFVLDWNNSNDEKYPFKLFNYQTQLMKEGLYDSYNQWMFGPADNQASFESWANLNKDAYDRFTDFHKSRIFKMPPGQVYSAK